MTYKVAIIGATGNIGHEVLQTLATRGFPVSEVIALASGRSSGGDVSFGEDKLLKVQNVKDFNFKGTDIAIFVAGDEVSKEYAPVAAKAGAVVIDSSAAWSADADVPLIVPELNPEDIDGYKKKNIITSPNGVAVQTAFALKPLHDVAGVKRIVISTYQAVSDQGRRAMDELFNQTKALYASADYKSEIFAKQISFNIIPQIGAFVENGNTAEEERIAQEIKKIFKKDLAVSINCVYVPVFVGHSVAVNVEFDKAMKPTSAREAIRNVKGMLLIDKLDPEEGFVTPAEIAGDDSVYVSRIREDASVKHGLNMWIVSDNLRKGGALNIVQIAELLAKKHLKKKS